MAKSFPPILPSFTIIALILAGMVTHALAVVPNSEIAQHKDEAWYRKHGVRVVNQPDAAPMSFKDEDGTPKGFVIDFWKEWSEGTKIPVTFHFASWEESFKGISSGKHDVHGGLLFFPNRAEKLDFSRPYHGLTISLVVNKDHDAPLETIASQCTVGIMDMGTTMPHAPKLEHFKITKYPTLKNIALALDHKEAQAAIGNYPVLAYELKRLDSKVGIVVKKDLLKRPLHAAVAIGNTSLLALVNKGVEHVSTTTYSKIRNKWFVHEVDETAWGSNALAILAGLTTIATVVLYISVRRSRRRR